MPPARAIRCNLRSLTPTAISASIPIAAPSGRYALAKRAYKAASRRDCALSHTCSLQQPCGSSGRSAPCGLAQGTLGRAVKVADREDGARKLSKASRVAHRPLKRGAGASARR